MPKQAARHLGTDPKRATRAARGGTHQVPQLGPISERNAPQQSQKLDLGRHRFTSQPIPQAEHIGRTSKRGTR